MSDELKGETGRGGNPYYSAICGVCGKRFEAGSGHNCINDRLSRLERAVVALGEALLGARLVVPGVQAYGVMSEATQHTIEAAIRDLRGDSPGTGEG